MTTASCTRQDLETQIGNDIVSVEAGRLNLRTQFDRGVVTHFEAQETLLDYSLTHLGVNTASGLQHPVVISEPPANLNVSRAGQFTSRQPHRLIPRLTPPTDSPTSSTDQLPDQLTRPSHPTSSTDQLTRPAPPNSSDQLPDQLHQISSPDQLTSQSPDHSAQLHRPTPRSTPR